jgi:hypothetical protein
MDDGSGTRRGGLRAAVITRLQTASSEPALLNMAAAANWCGGRPGAPGIARRTLANRFGQTEKPARTS